MKTDAPKYLTLSGNTLHVPLWKTFHQTVGYRAGVLSGVFALAADMVTNGGDMVQSLIPIVLTVPAIVTVASRAMQSAYIDTTFHTNTMGLPFKKNGPPLAIDTKPHENVRTLDNHLESAKWARNLALLGFGGLGAFTMWVGKEVAVSPSPTSEKLLYLGLLGQIALPYIETLGDCARRFNKVVKGEYAIVDAPPKPKREAISQVSDRANALAFV